MAIIAILLKFDMTALVNMTKNMVNFGIDAKNMKNVHYLLKWNWKIGIGSKAETKIDNFLCILVQNLKWAIDFFIVKKFIFIWYFVSLSPQLTTCKMT